MPLFILLKKSQGGEVWVNPEQIALMQQIEVRRGQTITSLTLTTTTSLLGPNGEPYQENTVIKVTERPQQIVDRIGSKK